MKTLIGIFVLALLSGPAFANKEAGNGGDVAAQGLVSTMKQVLYYLVQHPYTLVNASRPEGYRLTKQLQESLGQQRTPSLVEVLEQRPKDKFGVEKAVVTSIDPLYIKLHRDSWEQPRMTDRERVKRDQVVLAGMELLLLAGIEQNRYELADKEFGANYLEVLKATNEIDNPTLPLPAGTEALPVKLSGRNFKFAADAFFQLLKNSKFRDCKTDISISIDTGKVNASIKSTVKPETGMRLNEFESEKAYELSRNEEGSLIRMRANAIEANESLWLSRTWDDPVTGLIMFTAKVSSDNTKLTELAFQSYALGSYNAGTPTKPDARYGWHAFPAGAFACHGI